MSQTPPPVNPYAASAGGQLPPQNPSSETDATGGLIPYKNPHALIAYYLGLFSLFPCLGLFAGDTGADSWDHGTKAV